MNKTTEALKLAEEALYTTNNALMVISAGRNIRQLYGEMRDDAVERCNKALAAIREALAEPVNTRRCSEYSEVEYSEQVKQEPVAWDLAEKVLRDLDRQSCPCVYMNIAFESIVKNYAVAIRGLK